MRILWLLLLVPIAAGQVSYSLELEVDDVADRVATNARVDVAITWTLTCEPGGTDMAPTGPAHITFDITAPDDVVVAGPAHVQIDEVDCTAPVTGSDDISASGQSGAPGLTPLMIDISADAEIGSKTVNASADFTIEFDYVGLVQVSSDNRLFEGEPDSTSNVFMTLQNHGNAPSKMLLSTEDERFALPEDPVLDIDETRTITITYGHPNKAGRDNSEQAGRITVTPVAAVDETLVGQPVEVNLLARTQSTPAPLGVLALVGAAWLARRKH